MSRRIGMPKEALDTITGGPNEDKDATHDDHNFNR